MDPDALSASQKDAVAQLQALTNGGDPDVAIGVLASVDWDVQRAAELVFDGVPPAASTSSSSAQSAPIEQFEIDDTEQDGLLSGRRSGREFRQVESHTTSFGTLILRPLRVVLSILAVPLYPLFSMLRYLFRVLRIPLPAIGGLNFSYRSLGSGAGSRDTWDLDPKSAAERWVRALEDETGAVCIGRSTRRSSADTNGRTQASASGAEPGPSSVSARSAWNEGADGESERKQLPSFYIGSYEHFVRMCQSDAKIGCVVLVSEEHDDVAEFKRSTLTDPAFLRIVQENEIQVWGADIRDREGWSASQKLQATTYPFVAFIALQPRRAPAAGSTPAPTMTILSRHQGPSIPSTSAPTAAATLVAHLTENLLPRVTPVLTRVRAQAAERERERQLRAEQDRAFEESKRRDRDRIEARRKEERDQLDARRRAADDAQRAEAERQRKAQEAQRWAEHRMAWRRWIRRGLVLREPRPGEAGRGKTLRVGVRLPDGRRLMRFLGEGDALSALYAYVDSLLIPPEYGQDADPQAPPGEAAAVASAGEEGLRHEVERSGRTAEKWWGFKLVLAYPRREIPCEWGKTVGGVDVLKGGGQVVVEFVGDVEREAKGKSRARAVDEDEDDEYHTEESE